MLAGVALPRLARRDRRLVPKDDETDDVYKGRLRIMYKQWVEATDKGKPIKLPRMPLLLRDIWMGAMLLFSILTFSTFWIRTVPQVIRLDSMVMLVDRSRSLGYRDDQPDWHLLGSGVLGSVYDRHGGKTSCPRNACLGLTTMLIPRLASPGNG